MNKIAIGLMSGTSADGLTISAVSTKPFKVLYSKNYPYPLALQKKIISAFTEIPVRELSYLNFELGKMYAALTKKFISEFKINRKNISSISSHGQTITYNPSAKIPNGLVIGTGAFLAAEFEVPVITGFREKDIALGGKGAPLIPFFDEYIFGNGEKTALLNLGGIGNVSFVGKGFKTYGFDTGPANSLMDYAMLKTLNKPYDKNGALAAKGKADEKKLAAMLRHKYFTLRPPKTLDREDFGIQFLNKYFPGLNKNNIADALATLNMFTAKSAALGVKREKVKKLLVSGGGALNKTLINNLKKCLPGISVETKLPYGLTSENKESAAFALFGALALEGKPNHCPRATGARKQTVLGVINL